MTKKISVYLHTTTDSTYKSMWMRAFHQGVSYHNDWESIFVTDNTTIDTEYAFCFAYQVKGDVKSSDTSLRRQCIEKWEPTGKIFYLDSDILISYDGFELAKKTIELMTSQGKRYVRFPYSSIYANKANYFFDKIKAKKEDLIRRWEEIKRIKNIEVKPYDNKGDYILITCNRGSEGYSAEGLNATTFAIDIISELKNHTNRPIIVRYHRANSKQQEKDIENLDIWLKNNSINNVSIQSKHRNNYPNNLEVIKNSYAVITYSSSSASPAIIEGKPLYVKSNNCYFYDMSCGDLKDIENPLNIPDREEWFLKYAGTHYNIKEIESGYFFGLVKEFI